VLALFGFGVEPAEATAYTITVTGGPIKDWNTPATWSPAGVPGSAPGDTVNITTANAQVQLTTGLANPLTSCSISGTNILIEVAGGNLAISGSGSTVTAGATIRLTSGGTLTAPGGASSVGIGPGGTFDWQNGTVTSGIVVSAGGGTPGVINVSGPATLDNNAQIQNNGTFNYSNGPLALQNGASILNQGTFSAEASQTISSSGAPAPFISTTGSGSFARSLPGPLTVAVRFLNSAVVSASTGSELTFTGGGDHTGSFTASGTGRIEFAGGIHNINSAGAVFSGDVRLSSGTLTFNQPVTTASFTQTGGALTGPANFTTNTLFTWSAGTQSGGGSTITSAGSMNLDGAVGPLTLSGRNLVANGGDINYSTSVGNALSVDGAAQIQIANAASSLELLSDAPIKTTTSGTLSNTAGVVRKSGGAGTSEIQIAVTNGAQIVNQIPGGTVAFKGGGSSTGPLTNTNPSGTIDFTGGVFQLNPGSSLTGGQFRILGTGIVELGTTITVDSFVIDGAAATLTTTAAGAGALNLTAAGAFDFRRGVITRNSTTLNPGSTTLAAGATMNVGASGAASATGWTFTNSGTLAVVGPGSLDLGTGADIQNESGGVVRLAGNFNITASGVAVINNKAGATLEKNAGALTSIVGAQVDNAGSLIATIGTLTLSGGGTNTGTVQTNGSSDVRLSGGTFNWNGGSFSGSGPLEVAGGTLMLNASLSLSALELTGGTIDGPSALATSASFLWTSGQILGASTASFNTASQLQTAASNLILTDRVVTFSGTVGFGGTAGLQLSGGASIINNGAFTLVDDQPILGTAAQSFVNNGVLEKNGVATSIGVTFDNPGSVVAQTGNLTFLEGGNDSGPYGSVGGSVTFAGGTRNLSAASSVAASCIVRVTGATVTSTGAYSANATTLTAGSLILNGVGTVVLNSFVMDGGMLGGTAATTIGTAMWRGGTITGTGSLAIANGAAVTLGGSGGPILDGRAITNNGNVTVSSTTPFTMSNGASWTNGATGLFDITSGQNIAVGAGAAQIDNNGTFRKSSGASMIIQPAFLNTNLVQAQANNMDFAGGFTQTAGVTTLGPGSITSSFGPLQINGGELNGSGQVGSIINAATVRPGTSPGQTTVNGNYTQTAAGTLAIELGGTTPGTGYDRLVVTGTANLAGTLDVTLFGGFVPSGGQVFQPLTFASRGGDFNQPYTLPSWTGTWATSYTAGALQLNAIGPPATVTLVSDVNPSTIGQTVTFTATLPGDATGTVQFQDNGANLGSPVSVSAGSAQLMTSTLTLGTHPITALYSGDLTYAGATSEAVSQVVSLLATTTTLSSDINPSATGQLVTFTASVTPVATGTIQFQDNGTNLGGPVLLAGGSAQFMTSALALGTHPITATYSGDAQHASSISQELMQIVGAAGDADLIVTVSPSGTPQTVVGATQMITYTINNGGPSSAFNSVFGVTIPAGATINTATSSQGSCTIGATVACSLGTLANGGSVTVTLNVTMPATGGAATLTGTASSTSPDPNAGNSFAAVAFAVASTADIPTLDPRLLLLLAAALTVVAIRMTR
jgi:hypothetical protein